MLSLDDQSWFEMKTMMIFELIIVVLIIVIWSKVVLFKVVLNRTFEKNMVINIGSWFFKYFYSRKIE